MGVEPGESIADDVHKDIDHKKTQHDGVEDVPLLGEEGGAGDHAVEHERAH